jgi:hypothetical protein
MTRRITQSKARQKRENMMIFVSSCVESAARRRNVSTTEMYRRMKHVGLIDGFILKCYDGTLLYTFGDRYIVDDVVREIQGK